MKLRVGSSFVILTLCGSAAIVQLGGCSSITKPVEVDGSSRVPANDPARLQALQQRIAADRELLTQNNLLRAQVDVLQVKLREMTTIVREALSLPPSGNSRGESTRGNGPGDAIAQLPEHARKVTPTGVVIRVFHGFAKTDFVPGDNVAQALRLSAAGAEHVTVSGHTDSAVVNPADRWIAIQRAEKARTWLINNGIPGHKIRTRFYTAGNFLADNGSPEGRSMNRRVEIDIHNRRLVSDHLAAAD